MLFRFLIILGCIVLFINGCNSLISQHFGTHKLRSFQMEEVLTNGIGDADFVEISGAWTNDDFIHVPDKNDPKKAGMILFPVLSEDQLQKLDGNEVVKTKIIAWSEDFPYECLAAKSCAARQERILKGITRKINDERNKVKELPPDKYQLMDNVIYLNINNAPTAWYWNLLMMVVAFLTVWLIQVNQFKKKKEIQN